VSTDELREGDGQNIGIGLAYTCATMYDVHEALNHISIRRFNIFCSGILSFSADLVVASTAHTAI
jgi:hypothetical protein